MKKLFALTPEAKADLRDILLGIAEDSPGAAERLRIEIYEGFKSLGRSPAIGHYHEELLDRHYRFWNFYSYVVCYRWEQRPIEIIAILYGKRDIAAFFATRGTSS